MIATIPPLFGLPNRESCAWLQHRLLVFKELWLGALVELLDIWACRCLFIHKILPERIMRQPLSAIHVERSVRADANKYRNAKESTHTLPTWRLARGDTPSSPAMCLETLVGQAEWAPSLGLARAMRTSPAASLGSARRRPIARETKVGGAEAMRDDANFSGRRGVAK